MRRNRGQHHGGDRGHRIGLEQVGRHARAVMAAAAAPTLARRLGTPPSLAVALVVLNPLTLIGLVSPGHNDALMAGLVVGAMAVLLRGRPMLAVVLCALAAAVKAPALVATAFVAWQWAGQEPSWRGRIRIVAVTGAITLAVLEALAVVTTVGWGWLTTLGDPGGGALSRDPDDRSGLARRRVRARGQVRAGPDHPVVGVEGRRLPGRQPESWGGCYGGADDTG